MTNQDVPLTDEEVLRSYRDAEFRGALTTEQLQFAAKHSLRPDDYIGGDELSDEDLETVAGGAAGSGAWYCIIISDGSCCSSCGGGSSA